MTICVVGNSQDLASVYVSWLAKKRDIQVLELDEARLGFDWTFGISDKNPDHGRIETKGKKYWFNEISGAYVRFDPQPFMPRFLELPQDEAIAFISERRAGIHQFLDALPCLVANRRISGRSNGSKPLQMNQLLKAGFLIPKWIATNQESIVRGFLRKCQNGAIYKSCSGLRSRVQFVNEELFNRLRQGTTPVVIQEFIPGKDVRIHTVSKDVFATKIESHSIDYRFGTNTKFFATQVPSYIAQQCGHFAASENLVIAGFDFRVTAEDRWYCLEMNPMPTFLPYELATSQPIGSSLLNALSGVTT